MTRFVQAAAAVLIAAACSGPAGPTGTSRVLSVVAAENSWGSIAEQVGGGRAGVQSVLSDPNADPHEYESSTNDARAFARADVVILNGAGYDDWGRKLLDANRSDWRTVLVVADVLGRKTGDNPHFWYDPAAVALVADRIAATFESADPPDAAYFDRQRAALDTALGPYRDRIAGIRQKFSGVPVGATETVFAPMASALGLVLVSPPAFMQAVSTGTDPPAPSVVQFQDQVRQRQIRVLVYNGQTATAVTTNVRRAAAAVDIPTVGVSETLQPESATFQGWQLAQLLALENALNAGALAR